LAIRIIDDPDYWRSGLFAIRIIGDPDNQVPNKWSSTVYKFNSAPKHPIFLLRIYHPSTLHPTCLEMHLKMEPHMRIMFHYGSRLIARIYGHIKYALYSRTLEGGNWC